MDMREYQALAQRTSNTMTRSEKLENGCLGLAGECGEVCDVLKKYLYQGHELNTDRRKLIEEAAAVDAAPVVHARWIQYEPDLHGTKPLECGAKMDGGADDHAGA